MDRYKLLITGGNPLRGETSVFGGKNTSVAVLPATLLCDEPCVVENLPDIEDVHVVRDMLELLGAQVDYDRANRRMTVDPRPVRSFHVPYQYTQRMRASYYLWGALLGRCGQCEVGYPGGCAIGNRPFEQHIKGFRALGAQVDDYGGMIYAKGTLVGADVFFDRITVGGTINVMLAAARAHGNTTIHNAAREPHIVDLANFLNSMGGRVRGAGTDTIRIRGVERLHGTDYSIIPDQIEAGTFMFAAAVTHGDVTVHNIIPQHMDAITAKLREMGCEISEFDESIRVVGKSQLKSCNVKTLPYPGFPTDMQPQICVALSLAAGRGVVTESIFESRFKYVDELTKMGAHVKVESNVAVIDGVRRLTGAELNAPDLRAGAALVLAGLCAEGITTVNDIEYIMRGYEDFDRKLRELGAVIELVDDEAEAKKFRFRVG